MQNSLLLSALPLRAGYTVEPGANNELVLTGPEGELLRTVFRTAFNLNFALRSLGAAA